MSFCVHSAWVERQFLGNIYIGNKQYPYINVHTHTLNRERDEEIEGERECVCVNHFIE